MKAMTIRIPDDLARALDEFAATEKKSVEQVAVDRLRAIVPRPTAPATVLRTIQELPHPSVSAVDDLDAAIVSSRLGVRDHGVFEASRQE